MVIGLDANTDEGKRAMNTLDIDIKRLPIIQIRVAINDRILSEIETIVYLIFTFRMIIKRRKKNFYKGLKTV